MKKFILGAAFIAVASVATSASALENYGGTLIKLGSRGEAVKTVQMCLAEMGYSNAGSFDGIYGTKTLAQVKSYQADKSLAQDGIVGPKTWAALDCKATDTDTDTDTPEFDSSNGEEADVTVDNLKKVDDLSNNKEGQEAFTFEVEADDQGGAAQVERVDLQFDINALAPIVSGEETDLYDIIEKVTIEVDGKEVASIDSNDDSDWRDLTSGDEQGVIRLSGLDTVVKSDDTVEFTVLLDIADLDENDDLDLEIALEHIAVRYTDEAGITEEETLTSTKTVKVEALDSLSFDIDENKDNPENTTVALDQDQDAVVAFINDVTVEEQDGTLEKVTVALSVTAGATVGDLEDAFSDATLMFGDEEVDADDIDVASATLVNLVFDMDDMEISVDDEFEVSVELDLNELEDTSTVIGKKLEATTIKFEGEDEDGDDFTATETVDNAPELALSAGALKLEESNVTGYTEVGSDDQAAKAIFTFEVTADGDEDIRVDSIKYLLDGVAQTTALGAASANADYSISIKDGDGDNVTAPVVINDGSTEKFTVTVIYDNTGNGAGNFELEIDSINWTEDTGAVVNVFTAGTTGSLTLSLEADDIDLVN